MRLLHVHDVPRFAGGVEQILFDTALGLNQQGWSQALLHSDDRNTDAGFLSAFEITGSHHDIVTQYRPDVILMHKVSNPDRVGRCSRTAPTAHMVHDHDLVCPRRHKYFPLSKKICTKPAGLACYQHLCCIQRAPDNKYIPIKLSGTGQVTAMLNASKAVKRYIVGSRFMRSELIMNGVDESTIDIINPVPAALTAPRYVTMQQKPEILFVGQVIRGKGVDLMLRALTALKGSWSATIVGTGNHLDECRQLARKLNLSDRVVFTGRVDHDKLESYYAAARVIVVPSRWPEPFGMVGIEAMARGRPVVAFNSGGISDWLNDRVTGLLVPPANIPELTSALQRLVDEPEMAEQFGHNAVNHVAKSFSHKHYLNEIMKKLESLR